jgi:hypothetical protein
MIVESREPTNDSGFFHFKHSDTIAIVIKKSTP